MKKIVKVFNAFEIGLSVALLLCIIALVFFAAIARTIGYPVPWSVDLAQTLYAWFAFMAASIALKNKKHIGVDMLSRKLPRKVQLVLEIIGNILTLAFLGIVVYYGVKLSIKNVDRLLNSLAISYSVITISVAYGCFSMFITSLIHLKERCVELIAPKKEQEIKTVVEVSEA